MKKSLTYDDIQLVPRYSDIPSRNDIKLHTLLTKRYGLLNPIVASPMDTVCELEMAYKMFMLGGVGCVHRFNTIEEQSNIVKELYKRIFFSELPKVEWNVGCGIPPIMAAIGVSENDKERATKLVESGCNVILIDVAHGHHALMKKALTTLRQEYGNNIYIMAGNVCTLEGINDLADWGADAVRCNIGGGSICSTRLVTGHGLPGLQTIFDCAKTDRDVKIIAVLREPVARLHAAYSHYEHYAKRFGDGAAGFDEFVNLFVDAFEECAGEHGVEGCAHRFEAYHPKYEAVFYHADQLIKTMYAVFLEGWLARQAYASLYRMHQLSIHGAPKTGLAWLVDKLNRYLKPRMKLH